jgi:mono/diheme cytochrome c family protein
MVLNSKLTESQDFHLSGLLLIVVATVLGLALSLAIFMQDQANRAARDASAQRPSASAATAPPPAAAPPASAAASAAGAVSEAAAKVPARPPAPSAAADPSAGSTVFATNCGACHPNGGAGLGPTLLELSDDALTSGTREGVGMMPAFTLDRLSDQQLQDIIAFLRSTS